MNLEKNEKNKLKTIKIILLVVFAEIVLSFIISYYSNEPVLSVSSAIFYGSGVFLLFTWSIFQFYDFKNKRFKNPNTIAKSAMVIFLIAMIIGGKTDRDQIVGMSALVILVLCIVVQISVWIYGFISKIRNFLDKF